MRRRTLLCIGAATAAASAFPASAQEINAVSGAGSTFAWPIISRWSRAYRLAQTGSGDYPTVNSGLEDPPSGSALDYEPSGSLAGVMRVTNRAVDFGATDMPLKSDELAKLGLGQFPIVMGGVLAVVNIDGVASGQIKFTGQLLADIYLGKIRNWSDPAIKALNPDVKLPDAQITVIHRADGSGTTFNWADFLSKASPEWRDKVGADTVLKWPTGTGARGNEGVALAVKKTKNAIGYVEYAQAMRTKLDYALIQNRAGQFVKPEARSFQAAAASGDWAKTTDFYLLLTDAPGDDAYPITATVFILMHKQPNWLRRPRETFNFFDWALDSGAKHAAALGYVPLPAPLVKQVKDYWSQNFRTGR